MKDSIIINGHLVKQRKSGNYEVLEPCADDSFDGAPVAYESDSYEDCCCFASTQIETLEEEDQELEDIFWNEEAERERIERLEEEEREQREWEESAPSWFSFDFALRF